MSQPIGCRHGTGTSKRILKPKPITIGDALSNGQMKQINDGELNSPVDTFFKTVQMVQKKPGQETLMLSLLVFSFGHFKDLQNLSAFQFQSFCSARRWSA